MRLTENRLLKIISEEIASVMLSEFAESAEDTVSVNDIIASVDELLQQQGHGNLSGAEWDPADDHELDLLLDELEANQLQELWNMKCNVSNGADSSGAIPWPTQSNPCLAVRAKGGESI